MTAPAPAPAGPRPAASPRAEAPTGGASEPTVLRKDGAADFGTVLAGRSVKRPGDEPAEAVTEPAEVEADPAPTPGVLPVPVAVPAVSPVAVSPEAEAKAEPAQALAGVGKQVRLAALPGPAAAAEIPAQIDGPEPAPAPVVARPVLAKPRIATADGRPEPAESDTQEAQPAQRGVAATPVAAAPDKGGAPAPPALQAATDAGASGLMLQPGEPPPWRLSIDHPAASRAEARAAALPAADPQAVIGQIAVAVGKSADRKVEIRLDPPELGRMQIHLTPTDGGVQAVVMAERPETQDLLRRHAEILVRDLGAAGYGSVSLDFASGSGAEPGRQEYRAGEWAQAAVLATAAEGLPAAPRPVSSGGLDVRL